MDMRTGEIHTIESIAAEAAANVAAPELHGSALVASNCCGEPPRYVWSFGRWKLMCDRCGRNSSLGVYLLTIARAITAWNTLEEPWGGDEKR